MVRNKAAKKGIKAPATKVLEAKNVWSERQWVVKFGKLKPGAGNPGKVKNLFRIVGEKIPYGALDEVKLVSAGITRQGVGVAPVKPDTWFRVIGRGGIAAEKAC